MLEAAETGFYKTSSNPYSGNQYNSQAPQQQISQPQGHAYNPQAHNSQPLHQTAQFERPGNHSFHISHQNQQNSHQLTQPDNRQMSHYLNQSNNGDFNQYLLNQQFNQQLGQQPGSQHYGGQQKIHNDVSNLNDHLKSLGLQPDRRSFDAPQTFQGMFTNSIIFLSVVFPSASYPHTRLAFHICVLIVMLINIVSHKLRSWSVFMPERCWEPLLVSCSKKKNVSWSSLHRKYMAVQNMYPGDSSWHKIQSTSEVWLIYKGHTWHALSSLLDLQS